MSNFSFNKRRAVLGVFLLLCLLCVVNFYFKLGVFGRFSKQAVIISFVVLAVVQHFIGPTLSEVREYRDNKRRNSLPG